MGGADGLEMGLGVMGGDVVEGRFWSGSAPLLVVASLAAVVMMATVSVVRGVRAFSFGLTWWGKHGQLRLRVESFTTLSAEAPGSRGAGGISGIFCAELVEEHEGEGSGGVAMQVPLQEEEGKLQLGFFFGVVKKGFEAEEGEEEDYCAACGFEAGEVGDWGVKPGEGNGEREREREDSRLCKFSIPDWACSLLEPLHITVIGSSKSVKVMERDVDLSVLGLQMRAQVLSRGRERERDRERRGGAGNKRHVVRGGKLMATSRDDVVRIWDSRHPVDTLYLPPGESVASIDVNWESGLASVGTVQGSLAMWDLERAVAMRGVPAHGGQVQALHFVPTSHTTLASGNAMLTGGASQGGKPGSAVSLWDVRMLAQGVAAGGVLNATVSGLRIHGHQIFVRDATGCISGLDVRKLGSLSVGSMPAEEVNVAAPQEPHHAACMHHRRQEEELEQSECSSDEDEGSKVVRSKLQECRWWEADVDFATDEDDEDGWPNGILCTYPEETSIKSSWIGRLLGEIKSQLHLDPAHS